MRNPIYQKALSDWRERPGRSVYIGSTETAKLIRAQLKARFPRTKFSVRTDKYSGGSSIRIRWTDGPTDAMVSAVVGAFAGSGFDGMTDYKYSKGAWLMPDGSADLREVEAHYGTDGDLLEPASDGAIPVSFCADFVFTNREISREAMDRALRSYAARYPGDELAEAIKAGEVKTEDSRWGNYQIGGNPAQYRGIGEGSQYGGDCVIRAFAARRMVAA